MSISSTNIDNYTKLNSGEGFMRMTEIQDEIIKPITMEFFINTESENYLLRVVLCFVNLALGREDLMK
jgi:hypothetical protein